MLHDASGIVLLVGGPMQQRSDGRAKTEMRSVVIVPGVNPYAEGSAEVRFGNTTVLITASVEREIPKWMDAPTRGWITAEYGMLPRSTHTRNRREASAGKQGGRTLEIQRLIGRALRQAVPLTQIPGITISLDCDVLVADGGTRTAAITGGWVALYQAIRWAQAQGLVDPAVEVAPVAAVSVGRFNGQSIVDLAYEEDSKAEFDLNLVFNGGQELIEIQGTAEGAPMAVASLNELLELGTRAATTLFEEQRRAVATLV